MTLRFFIFFWVGGGGGFRELGFRAYINPKSAPVRVQEGQARQRVLVEGGWFYSVKFRV